MKHVLLSLIALLALASPAVAEEAVRIGFGFGLAFLPVYICEDLKLVEKYGKNAHLELRPSYQRFLGAGPLQEALGSGAVDMAPFGSAPLLAAWEKTKDTPRQIFAVSGLTTLPPVLLTNRPDVRTLADFRAADRIAIPSATSPQLYLLQMQSEKVFGQYDKLRGQVVVRSHPDAVADLLAAKEFGSGLFFFGAVHRDRTCRRPHSQGAERRRCRRRQSLVSGDRRHQGLYRRASESH